MKALPDDARLAGAALPFAPPAAVAHSPNPSATLEFPPDAEPRSRSEPRPIPFSAPSGPRLADEERRMP